MACAEVAGDPPEVMQNGRRRTESRPAAADTDVEAIAQHEVGPPEGDANDAHSSQRHDCFPQTPTAEQNEEPLRGDDEHRVRMAREHQEQRGSPEREPAPPATVERRQQREEREQAREEEQAVHPPVDPVEHHHPASRGEGGRDDARHPVREPRTKKCDQRNARHGEHERDDAEPGQSAA